MRLATFSLILLFALCFGGEKSPAYAQAQNKLKAVWTMAELHAQFKSVERDPDILYGYLEDGCPLRVMQMIDHFERAGLGAKKIWIYYNDKSTEDLEKKKKMNLISKWNRVSPTVQAYWHVAPLIQVQVGNVRQNYVIDPSLFRAPVTQEKWLEQVSGPTSRAEKLSYRRCKISELLSHGVDGLGWIITGPLPFDVDWIPENPLEQEKQLEHARRDLLPRWISKHSAIHDQRLKAAGIHQDPRKKN